MDVESTIRRTLQVRLELKSLWLLPTEVLVGEVTVLGGLEVDWLGQVELLDNNSWAEVEVGVDDLDKLVRGSGRGSVGINEDGERLSNTDGVGKLNQSTASELGVDKGFGDPSGDIGGRSVNLGEILSGESTTTVSSPATVCVNDDLATGETSVTLWATNDEES